MPPRRLALCSEHSKLLWKVQNWLGHFFAEHEIPFCLQGARERNNRCGDGDDGYGDVSPRKVNHIRLRNARDHDGYRELRSC